MQYVQSYSVQDLLIFEHVEIWLGVAAAGATDLLIPSVLAKHSSTSVYDRQEPNTHGVSTTPLLRVRGSFSRIVLVFIR
jgi:hypothetical protein